MSDDASVQPHAVPKETTPTWEMELLVSGATVFALMQLPDLLDRAYFRAMNLSPEQYVRLLLPLWLYLKVATITLVATFVAHLCLRGYWVALVGMNSVYPGGIRWKELSRVSLILGPEVMGEATIETTIEQADNRATRVFATGYGFAMQMVKLSLVVLLLLGCSFVLDAVTGGGHAQELFLALATAVLAPLLLAAFVRRRLGDLIPQQHALQRFARRVLRAYGKFGMNNPLLALFMSHEGRTKAVSVILVFLLPVLGILMTQDALMRDHLSLTSVVGLDTDDPYSGLMPPNAFYADSNRERNGKLPLPYIPGRVIAGPYLPVFVPFIPRLHGPALEAACPHALATPARLSCLARLSAVRIDGIAQAVEFEASTDPQSGQPGMLAMLPVAALPAGRHELSLSAPAHTGSDPAEPGKRYRIPFWK